MNHKKHIRSPLMALAIAMFGIASLSARADNLFDLTWNSIDGGGGSSTDGSFTVQGTIGQPDAGRMTGGAYFSLMGGYWGAAGAAPTCPADFNDDGLIDDSDFVLFAHMYDILLCSAPEMTPDCPADLNGDFQVDDLDFVIFVSSYNELLCP